jgi:hypothetical protein
MFQIGDMVKTSYGIGIIIYISKDNKYLFPYGVLIFKRNFWHVDVFRPKEMQNVIF